MKSNSPTDLLRQVTDGDSSAFDRLYALLYSDLCTIARSHLAGNVLSKELSSAELVHEAYVRLIDGSARNLKSRTHFLSLGSKVMRQVMVDRARANVAQKRGGTSQRHTINDDLLSRDRDEHILRVDEALSKLAEVDRQQAGIVEMRFFGGLTVQEVADVLGKSKRWVESEWTMIRAWLRSELDEV